MNFHPANRLQNTRPISQYSARGNTVAVIASAFVVESVYFVLLLVLPAPEPNITPAATGRGSSVSSNLPGSNLQQPNSDNRRTSRASMAVWRRGDFGCCITFAPAGKQRRNQIGRVRFAERECVPQITLGGSVKLSRVPEKSGSCCSPTGSVERAKASVSQEKCGDKVIELSQFHPFAQCPDAKPKGSRLAHAAPFLSAFGVLAALQAALVWLLS